MSIKFLHRNHFERNDDLIVELLEADKNFLYQRKLDYINLKKTLNPNIFMSLKQQYINFTHLITKNAIVATVVMLIALTTVGASAAELFAPTEFKPSTQIQNLFGANKQTETDPYTALKPDSQNDVAISKECDLAIKYPKKIGSAKINLYREEDAVPPVSPTLIDGLNFLPSPSTMEEMEERYRRIDNGEVMPESDLIIRCLNSGGKQNEIQNYIEDRVNNMEGKLINVDSNSLRQETGWFITEAKIEDLRIVKGGFSGQVALNENSNELFFTFNDKIYWIIYENEQENNLGIFANQIQLQFNSLVKNEANAEILNTGQNTLAKASPLVADENYDVVVIEECDLAVRFKKGLIFEQTNFVPSPILQGISGESAIKGFSIKNSEIVSEVGRSVLCVEGKQEYYPVTPRGQESGVLKKENINQQELLDNKIDLKAGDLNFEKAVKDVPCCAVDNEAWIGFRTAVNNNTIFISDSFVDYESDDFLIQIQQNSLAPSTPSVTLKQNSQDSQTTTNSNNQNSNTPAKKTYTNPTYPNLRINYNDSWNMRVVRHSEQHYQDIEDVSVILQDKNSDVSLQFDLFVKIPTGCGGGGESDEKKVKQINNDLARYFDEYSNSYFYVQGDTPDTFSSSCKVLNHTLTSNLSRGELTANHPYFQNFPQDNLLEGRIGMTLTGSDSLGISKADQLVASSVFR